MKERRWKNWKKINGDNFSLSCFSLFSLVRPLFPQPFFSFSSAHIRFFPPSISASWSVCFQHSSSKLFSPNPTFDMTGFAFSLSLSSTSFPALTPVHLGKGGSCALVSLGAVLSDLPQQGSLCPLSLALSGGREWRRLSVRACPVPQCPRVHNGSANLLIWLAESQ